MSSKKLVVGSTWIPEHGGGAECLYLAYEHSWGYGIARNQLQFLADEINCGRIMLPPPELEKEEDDDKLDTEKFLKSLVSLASIKKEAMGC